MVYYRKYRPQTISDLDLSAVREKMTAILSAKELPHAFLFTGPKGLGKTSSARILAKAINCLTPKGIEPCNKCQACVSITNGSNIDVLEIDAASNGGVEEMRTLRERVKFASSTLKKKVYIIDEVHMLSTGAFNALLKTLEEPPSHVVFVLATTELWKLPPTVVSRTFQIQFEKPTKKELLHSLQRIIDGEKLTVEEGVLDEVYKLADGSFRDGAKLLEELALNSKGEKIDQDLAEKTFKTKGIEEEIYALLTSFDKRDAKQALESINKLSENGVDFKIVIENLVDHLRGLLMIRNGIKSQEKDIPGLTIVNIKDLLELSNNAYADLKVSIIPSLPLELMAVKYCIIDVKKIENGDLTIESFDSKPSSTIAREEKQSGQNVLPRLMELVNETNKPAGALLRSCKDAFLDGDTLIVTTPFPIHADRLKSDKVLPDILKAIESILGKKVAVRIAASP